MRRVLRPVFLAAIACASPAIADGGDIGLRIESGRITTWEAEHAPIQFIKPERVFVGEMALVGGIVESEEPGFVIESGSILGGNQLGFNILRAARVWDLVNEDFSTISPHTITIERALIGDVTTPLVDPPSPVPGLSFQVPTGGVDFHYEIILNGSTEGLYLLELEKWSQAPGAATSLPFWIVLNYGMSEPQEEAAVAWVNANLVPTPGAAAVLALGSAALFRRRR